MARFDEDWNPRAFGDNITAWGTPVVLIESGGLPAGREIEDLTRLNFVDYFYRKIRFSMAILKSGGGLLPHFFVHEVVWDTQ